MQARTTVGGMALALLLFLVGATAPAPAAAQQEGQFRPLQPLPPGGLPISPFFEGWYENEDGSYTYSFGYLNRNDEAVLLKPHGEDNYMEPDQFQGMQPTVFQPGRHRGAFAVTIDSGDDVWWYLNNENGGVHKVPGRPTASSYQLDRYPRPQGSVQPVVWFGDEDERGTGPEGLTAEETISAEVGEQVELSINGLDPSQRDPEDPRFREPLPLRAVFSVFQGPTGDVEWARHPSTPEPEEPEDERRRRFYEPPPPEEVMFETDRGTARVFATFPEPGEYVVRAQVDNWRASDSSSGDQCCWTNGYIRVNVE